MVPGGYYITCMGTNFSLWYKLTLLMGSKKVKKLLKFFFKSSQQDITSFLNTVFEPVEANFVFSLLMYTSIFFLVIEIFLVA
jgi:hypothetical protein